VVNQKLAANAEGFGDFLAFETLTLCPIDIRCIAQDLLEPAEKKWLNDYHAKVRQQLAPHLQADALDWLVRHTQAI
jgi:Xaa-Pro aminopeptidase